MEAMIDECSSAISTTLGAIFFSMELSRSKWLITTTSPASDKMPKYIVPAGDLAGLLKRLDEIRVKVAQRTGTAFPFVAIQEAGLDGFWIHRILLREGRIEQRLVGGNGAAAQQP